MTKNNCTAKEGKIIQIDEDMIKDHLGKIVKGTVEDTLNALFDADADRLCNAERYERTEARKDRRAGHYSRKLHTTAGEVNIRMPKLRTLQFETDRLENLSRGSRAA